MKHLTLLTLLVFAAPFGWGETKSKTSPDQSVSTDFNDDFGDLFDLGVDILMAKKDLLQRPRFLTDKEAANYQPNLLDRFYRKALIEHCSDELSNRKTEQLLPYMKKSRWIHSDGSTVDVRDQGLCRGKLVPNDSNKSILMAWPSNKGWHQTGKVKRGKLLNQFKKCFPTLAKSDQIFFIHAGGNGTFPKHCGMLVYAKDGLHIRPEVKPARIDFSKPSFIPYSHLLFYSVPGVSLGDPRVGIQQVSLETAKHSFELCLEMPASSGGASLCESFQFKSQGFPPETRLPELLIGYNEITFRKLRNIYGAFFRYEDKPRLRRLDLSNPLRPGDRLRFRLAELKSQEFLKILEKDNLSEWEIGHFKEKLSVAKELQDNLTELERLATGEVSAETKSWAVTDDFASCQALETIDIAYRSKVLQAINYSKGKRWFLPRVDRLCESWYPVQRCSTIADVVSEDDCKSRYEATMDDVNDEFINFSEGFTTAETRTAMMRRRDTQASFALNSYEKCMGKAVSEDKAEAQRAEAKAKAKKCEAENISTNRDNRRSSQACTASVSAAINNCLRTGQSSISALIDSANAANIGVGTVGKVIEHLQATTNKPFLYAK